MSALDLLLYCLAPIPALIVVALLVNIVANNIAETRATANEFPRMRSPRGGKR